MTNTGEGGGAACKTCDATIRNCTFYGNAAANGGGVYCSDGAVVTIENTIAAFSTAGGGVLCDGASIPSFSCCDIFGNEVGDWIGWIADQYGIDGNICEDPLFCEPSSGDFCLLDTSPCAPFSPPNPECDLIGAWPMGCGMDVHVAEDGLRNPLGDLRVANPAASVVWISYRIPPGLDGQSLHLAVYDCSGRLTRSLGRSAALHGDYEASWDLKDGGGRRVPAGVYFCRLSARELAASRPVLITR